MTFSNPFKKEHTKIDSGTSLDNLNPGGLIYTDSSTTSAATTDGSFSTAASISDWGVDMSYNCRICGEKNGELIPRHRRTIPSLCDKCDEKFIKGILEKMIPANSKVHCKQCKSHIKACGCSTKNALEKLKK